MANIATLENMHGQLLQALRAREQEIFSYLGILATAIGAFIYFYAKAATLDSVLFALGTISIGSGG